MARIGIIGLGVMGSAMAERLVRAGHDVTVYDIDEAAIGRAETFGATGADSNRAAVADAEVVFFSLPSPDVVETVVDDVEDAFNEGAVLVDLTTSTPETTDTIASRLSDRGVDVLGAPVSGGASGAEEGTLTVMVGGDRAVYEACGPFFDVIGSERYHVGSKPGHGHAVKLLNNYLSFTALLATSEAVILGRQAGLDPAVLVDVFNVSTGRNSATEDKIPDQVLTDEYDAGFALSLMDKDMTLFARFADDRNVSLLLGDVVENVIADARHAEGGEADMTRTYAFLEESITS